MLRLDTLGPDKGLVHDVGDAQMEEDADIISSSSLVLQLQAFHSDLLSSQQ